MSDNWMRKWVKKKIQHYEGFLKKNQNSLIRKEIEESIKILKELL